MEAASTQRVLAAWRRVTGAPGAFREPGTVVVARTDQTGGARGATVVTLAGATCVVASADLAGGLDARTAGRLTDPAQARRILGQGLEVLGPAVLAFADRSSLRAAPDGPGQAEPVDAVDAGAAELERLAAACDPAELAESGLGTWTQWVHVVRERGLVVAAAGIEVWAGTLAHVGVLTRADRRGRGLARTVAGGAARAALAEGLVAQWRARTTLTPSRRVAAALGFVELGAQVTYRLTRGSAGARR